MEHSLKRKVKTVHASKAKQGMHSPLATGKPVESTLVKQSSTACGSDLGRQTPNTRNACGQLWAVVAALSPPTFLCTPSLLTGEVKSRKGLEPVSIA